MNSNNALQNLHGTIALAGAGKMGGAMLTGWLAGGLDAKRVVVIEPQPSPEISALAANGIRLNPKDAGTADTLVVAVKPQMFREAGPALKQLVGPNTLVVSIMAGTPIAVLEAVCGGMVVRAMPNTPAAIGRGITVAVAAKNVSAAQRATADALLRATGSVEWVDDESLMDAVTAVSGSGPAYVFLLAEELARAGVEAGLPADLATKLARETVAGSGELLHRSDLAFRDAAPERHLARRHHGGRAGSADGPGRNAAADDPRHCRGDEAIEGTGEVAEVVRVGKGASAVPTIQDIGLGSMVGTACAFAHPTAPSKQLLPRKPLRKHLDIDEAAGVAAVADLALALEGFDLEADHAALHRDDFCRDPHRRADQRRAEMADIDLGPDRDPAGLKMVPDGVAGCHLHFQDHHRRRIDHRHAGHEMPDRALGRHDQRPLGAHADLDEFACVHGFS